MKKLLLLLFVLLVATSLFAYQNKQGVGVDAFINTGGTETTNHVTMDIRVFYTFMLKNNVIEIAPYIELDWYKDNLNSTPTDGYFGWGLGSMFYWHFVNTKIVSLSTGFDAGFAYGKLREDIYGTNSYYDIGVFVPIALDINLGKTFVVRLSQNIAGVLYTFSKSGSSTTDSFTFWSTDSFSPRFGFIITF